MEGLIYLVVIIGLIVLGYLAGKSAEKKHFQSIQKREEKFKNMPVYSFQNPVSEEQISETKLVSGSVVVSLDFFKRLIAALINIFGGYITVYETLLERARREAVLRMQEAAGDADMIINLRIETSAISNRTSQGDNSTTGTVEALAYGTAIKITETSV